MSRPALSTAFMALLRRDFLLAYRRRAELLQPLVFLLVVVTLFPLGVGPSPQLLANIAPGVIWVTALLAVLLSLERLFLADYEDGALSIEEAKALEGRGHKLNQARAKRKGSNRIFSDPINCSGNHIR